MGQGYSMTALSAAAVTIDVPELSDIVYEKTLVSVRFMKSVRARCQNGLVFVKAVQKPYASFDVRSHVRQIANERDALASVPNALAYQRIVEAGSAGFLVRQYMFSSVYDRLSTRPFLEEIERKWLAFQLLCAVRDCHARNIYHGDIKTENLLVTSWNWLFLADFSASFKPTTLPEDNPADYFFYFDTSGRRTCYIAPERFTNGINDDVPTELNWAMDMFSVGCTIAELFLEGPIFTLSQIFKYRAGDYDPHHTHINKIEDAEIRAMIANMISLDPEKRYSAEQHLSFYKGKIFPDYFYGFLHQYLQDLTEPSGDNVPISMTLGSKGESDSKIEKVYQDFDKISYFLGSGKARVGSFATQYPKAISAHKEKVYSGVKYGADDSQNDGTLLFLTLVSSNLRCTAKASARLKACDLLVAFADRLPDEAKLDRILPYIVGLLGDRSDMVKVAALHAMTRILETIEVVSPINAYLFPVYIFPKLQAFLNGPQDPPSPLVRAAYASCLASLALSSDRMLDMVQAIRADGRIPALSNDEWAPDASFHGLYDVARAELVPHFEDATTALITDPETSVRRALLGSVARLCLFFGSSKSSDIILSHLNTYLNDKDWLLRCSFFEALVGVALYIGGSSLEKFVLPVMVGSLTDSEGFVVEKVLRSLSRMAALGLFQKSTTWELVYIVSRFLIHPSMWIREAAVQFVAESVRYVTLSDRYCIVLPLLQPFLRGTMLEITEVQLLEHLKTPLPRAVYESALLWAARKEKSLFWTAASRDGVFVLSEGETAPFLGNSARRLAARIPPSQRDKDDQSALETLRNLGMSLDDEIKLLALREYILRLAVKKANDTSNEQQQHMMNNIVSLTQIGVTPQNVFFDQREPVREVKRSTLHAKSTNHNVHHSLADALQDATASTAPSSSRPPSSAPENGAGMSSPPDSKGMSLKESQDRVGYGPNLERLNMRVEGIKANERRASSVNGRHSLLDTDRLSGRKDASSLRHRGSAISLLGRADARKADAEIATTPETAFGRLDGQTQRKITIEPSALTLTAEAASRNRSMSPSAQEGLSTTAYEPNHSYTGNDPHILNLLQHHFAENFPIDYLDFGQPRPSADAMAPIKRVNDPTTSVTRDAPPNTNQFHSEPWRPSGQLLTAFSEHTAAINRIAAAPDHAFFVTASDDGTCKVWDTARLEKNVNPRSKYTHRHAQGAKVKSLCFVEGTHTFVSGADDGSIHAVRVEYRSIDGGESTKYGKPILARDYHIQPAATDLNDKKETGQTAEYAVWLHHYRTSTSQSILLAATNKSRILIIDLKSMELLHSMENPVHHGTPTTFCVDRRHHWLLLGTSHGILDLWDLRFRLRLRSFGIDGAGGDRRIERVIVHPSKGHGRWVIVSCSGEVSVWDIEKPVCKEILRPSTFSRNEGSARAGGNGKGYEAWYPDDVSSEKTLSRFAKQISTTSTVLEPDMRAQNPPQAQRQEESSSIKRDPTSTTNESSTGYPTAHNATNHTLSAVCVLTDYLLNSSQPSNPNKSTILITGGSDRNLRYWSIPNPENSFIVSGPIVNSIPTDDPREQLRVRYETSWPTSLSVSGLVQLVEEKVTSPSSSSNDQATPRGKSKQPTSENTSTTKARVHLSDSATKNSKNRYDDSGSGPRTGSAARSRSDAGATGVDRKEPTKPPRSSIISIAQQQLLRTHMDGITDVIVLKRPYGCIVSVDRMGNTMIFH